MNPQLNIEIVSDLICPWCYIGKRRLEAALQLLQRERPGTAVRVTWLPFELNPQMPREGMDRRTYRAGKFGSWAKSQQLDAGVAQAGRDEGLAFAHEKMERTPNTLDGHRLLWLALHENGAEAQNALAEVLFRAYFTQGEDVGDRATLVRLAASCGLEAARVAAFLESDEGTSEVRAEEIWASQQVSGVPFFVLNRQLGVSGAQPADVLLQAMKQSVLLQTMNQALAESSGESVAIAADGSAAGECRDGVCSVENTPRDAREKR